jgi:hypothetical protein
MATKSKTKFLATRVTPEDHKAFGKMAQKYGKPSDILRELVKAFNTERLTIKPPPVTSNSKESLFTHE